MCPGVFGFVSRTTQRSTIRARIPPPGGVPVGGRGIDVGHDQADGDAQEQGAGEDRGEALPGPDQEDECRHDRAVEHPARGIGRAQDLEDDVDDDHAQDHPGHASRAAEDHHRVDRDQERDLEVAREDADLNRREQRSREPGDRRSEHEREQLEPVHRHPHQLRRQGVLAQREPRAPRPRSVERVEPRRDDREDDEDEVVVAADRGDREPEGVDVVDAVDADRAAGEVDRRAEAGRRDPVGVGHERHERLAEEERQDREVVAEEAS